MNEKSLRKSRKLWLGRRKRATAKITAWKRARAKAQAMVARRTRQIKALPKGRKKALSWALSKAGTVERPANSNDGPGIRQWQDRFGMGRGPWCGAFVGNALEVAGIDVTSRIVYVPYIVQDGVAGINGMEKVVSIGEAKAGDLICFDWNHDGTFDHVGMVRKDYDGKGVLYTVEGNTSADNYGSQSNGGGVFLRSRPTNSANIKIVRPRY